MDSMVERTRRALEVHKREIQDQNALYRMFLKNVFQEGINPAEKTQRKFNIQLNAAQPLSHCTRFCLESEKNKTMVHANNKGCVFLMLTPS